MRDCKKLCRRLEALVCGEIEEKEKEALESHLELCPSCRGEFEALRKIIQNAELLKRDVDRKASSIDWGNFSLKISNEVFDKEISYFHEFKLMKIFQFLSPPRIRVAFTAILGVVLLGAIISFLILKIPYRGGKYKVSRDFIEEMELEVARRQTLDYLQKSQYILLELIQFPSGQIEQFLQGTLISRETRELIEKKKFINLQLEKFRMAKAKNVCDQIELLIFELIQPRDGLKEEDLERIKRLIEKKQLLLKINLLRKELETNEV